MQLILIWCLFVHFCAGTVAMLRLLLLLLRHSELGACCRSSRC
jgi:hypothetical protein